MSRLKVTRGYAGLVALVILGGCGGGGVEVPMPMTVDPARFRPVTGIITLRGTPCEKIVVAFSSKEGIWSAGETDAEGHYFMETMGSKGVPPGEYKVALSYFLSPEGKAQGLAARSSMVQSPEMVASRETLPPNYSDINQTKFKVLVIDSGNEFDFEIEADPKPPEAKPAPDDKKTAPTDDKASDPSPGGPVPSEKAGEPK